MIRTPGLRRLAPAALIIALAVGLAACGGVRPNTTFDPHTEFGRITDGLWGDLMFWGTLVFVLVEGVLLYVVVRYRHREGNPEPRHVHGNTTLEIAWTLIPAVILVFIAVPTVRAIFYTQAKAKPQALQVEVIGHQWWWEFRYPQYGVTTANELYLPTGRTVNFALRTADVLHSFWVPQLGGKRDLISNHTNYLWFTPDSTMGTKAWNGTCNEYCGASHANMRFRTYTVSPSEFDSWVQHQVSTAMMSSFPAPAPGTPAPAPGPAPAPNQPLPANPPPPPPGAPPTAAAIAQARTTAASQTMGYTFPRDSLRAYNVPSTPIPAGLTFPDGLVGDSLRGEQVYSRSACIGCHTIKGNPMSPGIIGPNLTHVGSRNTIAAGLFPNDKKHLALWIKNSRKMKPGVLMPTLGKGEFDPIMKTTVAQGGLDDQQIADIVAYLQALK